MEVEGSVALITGGASGLGHATGKWLAAAGASVALVDVDESRGRVAASEIDGALFIECDVRDPDSVSAAVEVVVGALGQIDILVNAAGVGTAGRVVGRDGALFDLDVFKFTIDVNLVGVFDMLRNVAGKMATNEPGETGERGVIVNVASTAAFEGQIGQAAYSASKGGIVGMTLPIARELGSLGIRVMTIAPAAFDTSILSMLPPEAIEALEATTVFPHRLGKPEEFARLVQSIVENPYLNGETIRIDAATRMPPR